MNIDKYQEACKETAIYRDKLPPVIKADPMLDKFAGVAYCAGKLNGEAGEIAEEVFKAQRDDGQYISYARHEALFKELGDVCWYLAMICTELGFKLENVMDYNLTKLRDRKERDVLSGSGSER